MPLRSTITKSYKLMVDENNQEYSWLNYSGIMYMSCETYGRYLCNLKWKYTTYINNGAITYNEIKV